MGPGHSKQPQSIGLDVHTKEIIIAIVFKLVRPSWGNDADPDFETEFRTVILNKKCAPKFATEAEQFK